MVFTREVSKTWVLPDVDQRRLIAENLQPGHRGVIAHSAKADGSMDMYLGDDVYHLECNSSLCWANKQRPESGFWGSAVKILTAIPFGLMGCSPADSGKFSGETVVSYKDTGSDRVSDQFAPNIDPDMGVDAGEHDSEGDIEIRPDAFVQNAFENHFGEIEGCELSHLVYDNAEENVLALCNSHDSEAYQLFALNAVSGDVVWEKSIASRIGQKQIELSRPVSSHDTVFIPFHIPAHVSDPCAGGMLFTDNASNTDITIKTFDPITNIPVCHVHGMHIQESDDNEISLRMIANAETQASMQALIVSATMTIDDSQQLAWSSYTYAHQLTMLEGSPAFAIQYGGEDGEGPQYWTVSLENDAANAAVFNRVYFDTIGHVDRTVSSALPDGYMEHHVQMPYEPVNKKMCYQSDDHNQWTCLNPQTSRVQDYDSNNGFIAQQCISDSSGLYCVGVIENRTVIQRVLISRQDDSEVIYTFEGKLDNPHIIALPENDDCNHEFVIAHMSEENTVEMISVCEN